MFDTALSIHQILVSREVGGAGRVALHLGRHVKQHGHHSRLWIPGTGPASIEASSLGLPFSTYDAISAYKPSLLRAGLANWRLSRCLRSSNSGIVHVHSPGHYGALRWGLKRSGLVRVAHVQLEESPDTLRW